MMAGNAKKYHEYVQLVDRTSCPNGSSRCLGIEECKFNTDAYPSRYVICEVKKFCYGGDANV
jgi:hypothetical protein